jgi:hypothetical protein
MLFRLGCGDGFFRLRDSDEQLKRLGRLGGVALESTWCLTLVLVDDLD